MFAASVTGMEDLRPTDTQIEFARTAGRFAADCAGKPAQWIGRRLGEAGLMGVLATQEAGGLGLGVRDALPLAIECALNDLAFPVVESMLATATLSNSALGSAEVLDGRQIATVAWHGTLDVSGEPDGLRLNGVASHAVGAGFADWIVVRVCRNHTEGVALLSASSCGISCLAGNELDTQRRAFDVLVTDVHVSESQVVLDGGMSWRWLCQNGKILRSADMYGCAKASFDAARAHTSQRSQFRRHLCANQSVRHVLARDYYGLENVRYSLEYAALLADNRSPEAAIATDVLCGLAAENCARAAENAIQLHGAMGFTTDMPLHHRLRRILATSDIQPARSARESLVTHLLQSWE